MSSKKVTTSDKGCLVLFSLPFTLVGLAVMSWVFFMAYRSWDAQNWVEVPAEIHSVSFDEHQSDDGSTYSVSATYSYEYDGREYSGDQVSFDDSADNLGMHQKLYAELNPYNGKTFRCFVDPENPVDAVLFPELSPMKFFFLLLFGGLFAAVGLGVMAAGLYGLKKTQRDQALAATHPNEPWRCNADWEGGFIKSGGKGAAVGMTFFALLWSAISLPVLFFVPEAVQDGEYAALIALLFPLVGLGLIASAIRMILRYRKYGVSVVELLTNPGVVGGDLRALVHVPRRVEAEENFRVKLSCFKVRVTGSGKNRSTSRTVQWQDEYTVSPDMAQAADGRTAIPVRFAIPYDSRESYDAPGGNDGDIEWKLEVEASTPGIDYQAEFLVPVFKTPESSSTSVTEASQAPVSDQVPAEAVDPRVVRIEDLVDGGRRFNYPAGRQKFSSLAFSLFGMIFLIAGLVLTFNTDAPIFMGIIFTLVGAGLAFGGVYLLTARTLVTIDRYGVTVRGGMPFLERTKTFSHNNISEINLGKGIQINEQQYYNIMLQLNDGKVKAGSLIPSRRMAEAIIASMVETLAAQQR